MCFFRENNESEKKPVSVKRKPIKDDRKAIIIKYVSENGFITNKQAGEMLGLADSTTKRILKEMVMEGKLLIERAQGKKISVKGITISRRSTQTGETPWQMTGWQ